jgi:ParE toxin of type II toxin-antitoxin system, parDE
MKKYTLVFTPEAIQEIRLVADWYNQQQKGLGKRFTIRLKKELDSLKPNPFSRSVRYDDVRFAVTDTFPYAAHYTINEEDHIIVIQAVIAFTQDPEVNWKKRKQ